MNYKKHLYTLLTVAIMALIFYFSSQNADVSGQTSGAVLTWIVEHTTHQEVVPAYAGTLIRKTAHFSIYFCLGMSTALLVLECKPRRRLFLWAWLIPVLYACTDEFHQYFVPGRSCEFRDVCIDSAGALLGVTLIFGVLKWRRSSAGK
jgi:VanZ family protein